MALLMEIFFCNTCTQHFEYIILYHIGYVTGLDVTPDVAIDITLPQIKLNTILNNVSIEGTCATFLKIKEWF